MATHVLERAIAAGDAAAVLVAELIGQPVRQGKLEEARREEHQAAPGRQGDAGLASCTVRRQPDTATG